MKDQDRLMASIMAQHEEEPHPNLTGDRLRLHIAIHTVVETQVQEGTPPEAAIALQRLIDEGLDRHEAIHALGTVVAEEIFDVMSEGNSYQEQRYVQRLRAITAESYHRFLEEMEAKPPGEN